MAESGISRWRRKYMKNGSTTSTARRVVDDCGQPLREPRRRKRDARFWDWILTVYTTNPSLRERWPGMRAVRIRETFVIREAAMARLDVYDPELYRAVVVGASEGHEAHRAAQPRARGVPASWPGTPSWCGILEIPARDGIPHCGSGGTADALASGASPGNRVGVQIPASAPFDSRAKRA